MLQIENVIQAGAIGLGDDGKVIKRLGRRKKAASAQALQPKRRASPSSARDTWQQQGPRGVHAKLGPKERRIGQLEQEPLADLIGGHIRDQLDRRLSVEKRQVVQNAIVVDLCLDVDTQAFAKGMCQGERPAAIDPGAERRVNGQPLVAQRVAKTLNNNSAIGRNGTQSIQLLTHVEDGVAGRRFIQTVFVLQPADNGDSILGPLGIGIAGERWQGADTCRQLAPKLSQAKTHVIVTLGHFAVPKGHARHGATGVTHDQAVLCDVLHAPGTAAQREHVALARLVDKLFIQGAQNRLAIGQHDAKLATVGDRSAIADGGQTAARQS